MSDIHINLTDVLNRILPSSNLTYIKSVNSLAIWKKQIHSKISTVFIKLSDSDYILATSAGTSGLKLVGLWCISDEVGYYLDYASLNVHTLVELNVTLTIIPEFLLTVNNSEVFNSSKTTLTKIENLGRELMQKMVLNDSYKNTTPTVISVKAVQHAYEYYNQLEKFNSIYQE